MSEELVSKLPGPDRAAILLMALGESDASEILKHMGPKEVQKIGTSMAALANINKDEVEKVLADFISTVESQTALGVGSEEYVRNVLIKALGEDKAGSLIDRILLGGNSKGLESLKWMDARAVSEMIRNEHPQIIAIILSYLDSDHSAEVLANFAEKVRADIIMRIAALDGIQPAALQELNDILEVQLSGQTNVASSALGGVKTAADILNFVDGSIEAKLMEMVKEQNEDLGQEIQDLMFVFDNLIDVDDRGMQTLLREVSSESLLLALKGSDDAMKEKIFANMSKRAAEMMRDDLEARGPVRLSEVEGAQKEILGIARRLSEEGSLALGGQGGDEFV